MLAEQIVGSFVVVDGFCIPDRRRLLLIFCADIGRGGVVGGRLAGQSGLWFSDRCRLGPIGHDLDLVQAGTLDPTSDPKSTVTRIIR